MQRERQLAFENVILDGTEYFLLEYENQDKKAAW